jgi:hypothetical protein
MAPPLDSLRWFVVAALALACEKPGVAPGLDQVCTGACPSPGVIQGTVVYTGAARGDAILLLFDTQALPPPDGTGTSAAAVARVPAATLFARATAGSEGPFSAPYAFTQVPAGRSYQIRAFLNVSGEFDPFFDFTQQPRAGDVAGGHGEIGPDGRPRLVPIQLNPGSVVSGVSVALTQTLPYDPPSFEIAGGSQVIDQSIDQPVRLQLKTVRLAAQNASFANAHFGVELDLDAQGNRRSTAGDGLDDVFPRVFLRQIRQLDGTAVAASDAAIVPCRAIALPVLPALLQLAPGAAPMARDSLEVFVLPLALKAADLSPLPKIPTGVYQTIVVEKSGQVWTLPNQLGDPAGAGTPYHAESQAQTVTFDAHLALPANSISGNVVWHGDTSTKSGNIVVQAYLDLSFAPPPPLGAAQPVRVQIIRAHSVTKTSDGFTVPYRIDGLPAGNYIVQALADVDENFSSLKLLQTPTKGDLVGAVIDTSTLRAASIAVSGAVTGKDVTLVQRIPLDPPAFTIDAATPAQMPADQVTPVRFDLRAQANAFPAGAVAAPHFAVQLVRSAGGAVVDADADGLPDVWPRVFLVRLDASDPTGLTQYVSPDLRRTVTQIIPAAIDPTPFLTALQPQNGGNAPPVITDRVTVVVRPTLVDASDPLSPPQRLPSLQPGAYKIVLVAQTGQIWQIPNEAGSAALDASVVCAAGAGPCAPGTVRTQSQSAAFQVGLPAHAIFPGAISGTLTVPAPVVGPAYVFAYSTTALPPFGKPLSADVHLPGEFQGGTVSYVLPDLPTGDYVVTALVGGGFAASPSFLALAPGAGTNLAPSQTVHVGTAPVANVNLTTAPIGTGERPSFQLVDGAGAPLTSDANVTFGGASTAVLRIAQAPVLSAKVSPLHPDTTGAFLVVCDGTGASLSVKLIKVSDAAGLTPELDPLTGKATVVPAAADPARFGGSCTPGTLMFLAAPLNLIVQNGSAKVDLLNPAVAPVPVALVPGRYALMVATSVEKQVWRVPNELQPMLMDPGAYAATPADVKLLLQSQQVAVQINP